MSEEEKKQKILDMWDKESLANGWAKEHIKYNYIKEDLDQAQEIIIELQQKIDKAIEYIKEHFMYHIGNDRGDIFFEDNYIQDLVEILGDKENE